jgi:hypothetical protein
VYRPARQRRLYSSSCVHKHDQGGMAKLEGQPLSAVVARIGQPVGERSIAGRRSTIGARRSCRLRATESDNAKSRQR